MSLSLFKRRRVNGSEISFDMASPQSFLVSSALRYFKARSQDVDVSAIRSWVNRLTGLPWPRHAASIQRFIHPNLGGEWIYAAHESSQRVVLYLHGGGYFFCSPRTYRPVTVGLSRHVGAATLALGYRLAPEHPYPAALDDALAGYSWLLEQGVRPDQIALAGDSAGGGLALATLVRLRDQGIPLPSACICFSPWTDLAATGLSLDSNDSHCAMFSGNAIRKARNHYLGKADPYHPSISPLYADLQGLPPLLIHVSDSEVLLDDSTRLAERARQAGVEVTLKVWSRLPHVWQLFAHLIPEGKASLQEASKFLRHHLDHGGVESKKKFQGDRFELPYSIP